MNDEPPADRERGQAARLAGVGFELAATLVGACLLGYWIDRRFGCAPWGLLICAAIGIVGGVYNLVRKRVHDVMRDIERSKRRPGGGRDGSREDDATRQP